MSAQTFQGRVLDRTTGKPVDVVAVSLLRSDSLTLDFTYTNESGHFSISALPGKPAAYIAFALLGYEHSIRPLSGFRNGGDILLNSKAFTIKEVKVSPERIIQRHDTIDYLVSGFKMAQDRSIGDVLKKMPGIEVLPGGMIKYQGKPINQFTIEGMNLLEGKYNLATQNLSANAVEKVQVLENHQPIEVLRTRNFSDQATLNLILKDDAKSKWMGTLDVGAGLNTQTPSLVWDNRLLEMMFNAKMQNLSMYKNNNAGMNIASEITPLTMSDLLNGRNFMEDENFILSSGELDTPELQEHRYLFNNSHLATINNLWRFKKGYDFRLQASYFHDDAKQQTGNYTTYFLNNKTVVVDEDNNVSRSSNEMNLEATYTINVNSLYLKNKTKIEGDFSRSNGTMLANGSAIDQHFSRDKMDVLNEFQLIKTIGKHTFAVTTVNQYSRLPQDMQVLPGQYADILNNGEAYSVMRQHIVGTGFNSHTYTSFQHKLFGFYIEYKAGVKLHIQQLNSQLTADGSIYPALADSFKNDVRYTRTSLYLQPSFNFQNDKWKINIQIPATLESQSFTGISTRVHPYMDPSFSVIYSLSALMEFRGNYSLTHAFADINSLYTGYVFTNYRSSSAYQGEFDLKARQNYGLTFTYKQPISGLFFYLSGSYSPVTNRYLSTTLFDGILQQTERILHENRSKSVTLSSRLSKTFAWLNTKAMALVSWSDSRSYAFWQNVLTYLQSTSRTASISFYLQPCRKINVEEESSLLASKVNTLKPVEAETFSVTNFRHSLTLNYFPGRKLQCAVINELYHSSDREIAPSYFADFRLSYLMPKSEIRLTVNNLFNQCRFVRESIRNLSATESHYELRPRQFMVKWLLTL
jgi:hypothetical protein